MSSSSSRATFDAIIVGGGAAGLAAAAFGTRRTLVLERLDRPGVKLLATGGGRCNLVHDASVDDVAAAFGRRGRFVSDALRRWDPAGIRRFFAERGVPTVVESDGCVFPASGRASDVRDALLDAARRAGVEIRCGVRVSRILLDEAGTAVRGVETARGEVLTSPRVVLATGGRAWPELGSDGSGLALARAAGLVIEPPTPALVPLVAAEGWIGELAGVSCPDAAVSIAPRGRPVRGPLLFTHRGLSGPAALAISGDVARLLHDGRPASLRIAFRADWQAADWQGAFDAWRTNQGARRVRNLLAETLPKALAHRLCALAGIGGDVVAARLDRTGAQALAALCAACPATISDTEGWSRAMVTRGGVALGELDPRTLESRRVAGLHVAGELVDLDAPCGGYNLTWAFASGRLAGGS
ncbi:MAG: NAD(P)/FAD-dependent oxidoreductase [Kiritimatiellia bacterium]|jgi:predicted Rossmann fold flavoprotein